MFLKEKLSMTFRHFIIEQKPNQRNFTDISSISLARCDAVIIISSVHSRSIDELKLERTNSVSFSLQEKGNSLSKAESSGQLYFFIIILPI